MGIDTLGHSQADRRADIGGVADGVAATIDVEIMAIDIGCKGNGSEEVAWRLEQDDIEPNKVAHKDTEQDATVLAVARGIKKTLVGKKATLAAELLLVGSIGETCLHHIEKHIDLLFLSLSTQFFAKPRVNLLFDIVAQRGTGIDVPMTRDTGIVVIEID